MRKANNDLCFLVNKQWECAWRVYGMRMGDKFLDTIDEPVTYKDPIVNECRTESGQRVAHLPSVCLKPRDLTLIFTFEGETPAELTRLKNSFFSLLASHHGELTVKVPKVSDSIYRLRYIGKGTDYSLTLDRRFCKIAMKFSEDNPANRGVY